VVQVKTETFCFSVWVRFSNILTECSIKSSLETAWTTFDPYLV